MAAPFLVDFETVLEIRKPEFVHFYEKKSKLFRCNCLDLKIWGGGIRAIEETYSMLIKYRWGVGENNQNNEYLTTSIPI